MKNKKPPEGDFLKWSSIDKALLPAFSGVVKTYTNGEGWQISVVCQSSRLF